MKQYELIYLTVNVSFKTTKIIDYINIYEN